mmetsp:Transcript_61797/g.165231  ORF Transcript_61797/g.165231 Transcript_61797/m.165231 type:complete len:266 (-) Transcript_61797:419-1216(-)
MATATAAWAMTVTCRLASCQGAAAAPQQERSAPRGGGPGHRRRPSQRSCCHRARRVAGVFPQRAPCLARWRSWPLAHSAWPAQRAPRLGLGTAPRPGLGTAPRARECPRRTALASRLLRRQARRAAAALRTAAVRTTTWRPSAQPRRRRVQRRAAHGALRRTAPALRRTAPERGTVRRAVVWCRTAHLERAWATSRPARRQRDQNHTVGPAPAVARLAWCGRRPQAAAPPAAGGLRLHWRAEWLPEAADRAAASATAARPCLRQD